MAKVKVSWSGGKDSTASVLLHYEQGDNVTAVYYIPMFTHEIPLISRKQYNFIITTAKQFERMGIRVIRAEGITYVEYCLKRSTRGKYKGRLFGFPCVGRCGFKRDSKIKALNSVNIPCDYEDIGIAYDEPQRFGQLNDKKRSILVENHYTEKNAFAICRYFSKEYNFISPVYEDRKRDGCALCFNGKKEEREKWLRENPEALNILKWLQAKVKAERDKCFPLRNHKYFINEDGIIN